MLKLSCVTYTLDKAEKRAGAFETCRQVPLKQIDSKLDVGFFGGEGGYSAKLRLTPKEVEFGHRTFFCSTSVPLARTRWVRSA